MSTVIENPHEFLEKLGYLHDARIERFLWLPEEKCLALFVDDINSNFEGLPEYEGCQPQKIFLEGVCEIELCVDGIENHLNVHEFSAIAELNSLLLAKIKFWPSGHIKVKCSSMHLEDVGNEDLPKNR